MAESYRGLTIKIGGETTGLQKALKAVNSAIRATDSEARKLKQALNLDPDSSKVAALNVGAVAEQASNAATKVNVLKTAMKQVGDTTIDGTPIKQLAEDTDTAALNAERALNFYNKVDAELEKIYNVARDAVGKEGLFTDESFEEDLQTLKELGVYTEEDVEHIRNLKTTWHEAFADLKSANAVQQFVELSAEEANAEARAKNLVKQYVELKSTLEKTDAVEKIDLLKTATDEARARFEALDKAAKLDPTNIELAKKRQDALRDVTSTSERYMEALNDRLKELESNGIKEVADSTATLKTNLNNSQKAAENAAAKYKEAEAALGELNEEYDNMRAEKGFDEGSEAALKLKGRIEDATEATNKFKRESDDANEAVKTDKAQLEYRELKDEIEKTSAETRDYENQSITSLNSVSTTLTMVAEKIKSKFKTIVDSALDSANEVDSAFRNMAKTVEASDSELEALKQGAIDFSKTHVTTAEQLLEIEAMGGQMGIAVEKLEDFAEVAASLDIATDIDAEEVSQNMGQLVNIMDDLDVDNLETFADGLVTIGNNLPATESETMQTAMRIAAQANILGMTTDKVLGWSAALAASGQNPEAAGTALSRTMAQIELAVGSGTDSMSKFEEVTGIAAEALRDLWNSDQEAAVSTIGDLIYSNADALEYFAALTGQTAEEFKYAFEEDAAEGALDLIASIGEAEDKLDSFAAIAGLTGEQFAAIWKNDASEAMQLFVEGLGKIDEEGGSVETTLNDLGITAVRQKQAIENLVQTSDVLNEALQMTEDAANGVAGQYNAAGAAAREADKKSEGLSGTYSKMQNSITALGVEFGEGLLPWLELAASGINTVTDILDNLGNGGKQAIIIVGGLATVFATLSPAIGTVITNWASISAAFATTAPILAAVTAIGLMVGAFVDLAVKLGEAEERHQRYEDALNGYASSCDVASSGVEGVTEDLREQRKAVEEANDEMDDYFTSINDMWSGFGDTNKNIYNTTEYLEDAYETLDKFLGRAVSTKELEQLNTAIDILNNALGTNYGIWEDESGITHLVDYTTKTEASTKAIYERIKALEYQMIAEATQSRSSALLEQMETDAAAVNEATETLKQAQENLAGMTDYTVGKFGMDAIWGSILNNITGYTAAQEELTQAQENYDAVLAQQQSTIDEYKRSMEQLNVLQKGTNMTVGEYLAYATTLQYQLGSAGKSQADFATAIDETGISLENAITLIDGLSEEGLQSLIDNFDGSAKSLENWYALTTGEWQAMSDNWKQHIKDIAGSPDEYAEVWAEIKQAFEDGKIKANANLDEIKRALQDTDSTTDDTKGAVENLESEFDDVANHPVKVKTDYSELTSLRNAFDTTKRELSQGITVPVKYSYSTTGNTSLRGEVGFATGYIKHARGYINNVNYIKHEAGYLDRPTDITRHLGGEAGPEVLLPLTKPNLNQFAGPLVEAMAAKVGALGGNSVVNVYIGEKLLASSPFLTDLVWDVLAEVDRLGGGNVR